MLLSHRSLKTLSTGQEPRKVENRSLLSKASHALPFYASVMNESDHVSQHTCSFSLHGANPHLETWVRQRVHPFDPSTDDYHRPPFSAQIQTTKQSAIYALHGYHLGKKPHDAIRAYVAHFTAPGDVVLDPFAGSGSTALAALQEHRHAIGIDASPAATFIARAYLFPIDINDLLARCEAMVQRAAD